MSLKWLVLAAVVGVGIVMVARTQPPAAATAEGDAAQAGVGFGARFRYKVGSVGSALVSGSVRRSVLETEQTLAGMSKAIKEAKGPDGIRAREIARKIKYVDSVAVENLYQGRPVQAVRQSMEAKSLLNAVRRNLRQQI
jgi:hypothetical protein